MDISRTVTRNYTIQKVAIDMFTYDESFRNIRSQHRYQGSECFACGHHFKDGEKMSLAIVSGTTNKMLCHSCAIKVKEEHNA